MITIFACGWLTMPHSGLSARAWFARCRLRTVRSPRGALAHRTLIIRVDVRGVWQQHGSGPDGRALPALTAARQRLARGLADGVRRRGHRLGRGPGDGRGGTRRGGVRGPLAALGVWGAGTG